MPSRTIRRKNGLKATGSLTPATRTALNREGEPKRVADPDTSITRIIINMERWRWLPDDMGSMYVWNNIPEYYTRVIKGGEEIFKEKIIVGQPAWATPVFSAKMQYIIFNPSWGVPDGIKTRELQPRLRAAGGGFFFLRRRRRRLDHPRLWVQRLPRRAPRSIPTA